MPTLPRRVFHLGTLICALTFLAPSLAQAARLPAAKYDHLGLNKNYKFAMVKPIFLTVPLLDGGGTPFGATAGNSTKSTHCPPAMPSCIRFLGLESPSGSQGPMFFKQHPGNGTSGFIAGSALVKQPDVSVAARSGNGKPAPDLLLANGKRKAYFVTPKPIEKGLEYHWISKPEQTSSFSNYGEPYSGITNLNWSWIDVTGGGVVRTVIRANTAFYPSNVETITSISSASRGWVKVMYGFVLQGSNKFYGWLVYSHKYGNGPVVMHVRCKRC